MTSSADWTCANYILSAVVCDVRVIGPDTSIRLKTILEFGRKGTRLAMPKTNLRAGFLVIEARFRGY